VMRDGPRCPSIVLTLFAFAASANRIDPHSGDSRPALASALRPKMLPLHQLRGGIKAVTSLEEPVPVKPANAPAISDTARTVLVCASIFIVWLAGATAVYSVAEGWSLAQSLFYAVDTGLSIGFGAFAEEKTSTKIFTICHVLLGASAAGGAIALFAESVVKNQGSMAALEYRKAALSAAFASADTSGDGEWCSQELDKALRSIGMRLSPDELKEAMGAFDHNEDGQIDHREFVEAMRPHLGDAASLEAALKAAVAHAGEKPLARMARQAWSVLVDQRVLVLWGVWIAVGAIWAVKCEGLDAVTGLYFAVGGLSTGGLQAPALTAEGMLPDEAALFVALYALTGVPIFGFALGRFADAFVTRQLAAAERRALRRPISDDEFSFAEKLFPGGADDSVELAEFLALELIRLGKVDSDLLESIQREFARLDNNGDGSLTRAEVKQHALLDAAEERSA